MAAPVLLKVKSATFKSKAIVHAQSAEISTESTEGMARGDGATTMQIAWHEGVHMRISVTALESIVGDADLTLPANGSLVIVCFAQAVGSGQASGGDKTFTFAPANEEAFARFAPGTKHQLHTENGVVLVDGARY